MGRKVMTKEEIESLGWKHEQFSGYPDICLNFTFYDKKKWFLNYWIGETPRTEIYNNETDIGFNGYLETIVDLQKMMEYLRIK
jgi:hypothetical protein